LPVGECDLQAAASAVILTAAADQAILQLVRQHDAFGIVKYQTRRRAGIDTKATQIASVSIDHDV
jgi:hypothetical protein